MVTGAPPPGGFHAPARGGLSIPAPGGVTLANQHVREVADGTPTAYPVQSIKTSGARSEITRTVFVRTGKSSVSSYSWSLRTRPGGSAATLVGATATVKFTPDMAGLFNLRCTVTFADSSTSVIDFEYTSA